MISWFFKKKSPPLDDQYYSEVHKDIVLNKLKLFEERLVKLQDKNEELERENAHIYDDMKRIILDQKHINNKLKIIKRKLDQCIILEPRSNSPFITPKSGPSEARK